MSFTPLVSGRVMDAIYISLDAGSIRDSRWRYQGQRPYPLQSPTGIHIDREAFTKALVRQGFHLSPSGASQKTESRFRMHITISDRPDVTGVYYVVGWLDEGVVSLGRDDEQGYLVPRRREAVLVTKRKKLYL